MKNQKTILIGLTASLLLSTFTACSRRNHYEDVLESKQESESIAEILEVNGNITGKGAFDYETPIMAKSGETSFYQGMNDETLKALYYQGWHNGGSTLFPLGRLYNDGTKDGFGFYNKLTGNVGKWCADPLCACDSEDCIWSFGLFDILYTSENWIYFFGDGYYWQGLYRCDLQRNHIELLDETLTLEEIYDIHCEKDGKLYFSAPAYRAGESSGTAIKVMNLQTKETTILHTDQTDMGINAIVGNTVYYQYGNDKKRTIYQTDLTFSESKKVMEGKEIEAYNDQYLILRTLDGTPEGFSDDYSLYHVATGEFVDIPHTKGATNFTLSGQYVYYKDRVVEEELENDPLAEYYDFMWMDGKRPTWGGNDSAGKLYRMNIQTGETECVIQLTYKGIPVRITKYEPDGEVVFFTFETHEEFENFYNHGEFDDSVKYARHYAVADFQNGTVTFLEIPKGE